jgi:3-hydroxyisobutyrate dehydrogenase
MVKPQVAFLGLGTMGAGMARRLLGAGFPLSIYNRSTSKAALLVGDGATIAVTPREAATNARFIVSMVADDIASRGVWLGEMGALAGVTPGAVLIESSTLSVEWIRELGENVRARGCELLDAPVTGSRPQAISGELSFLVGGPSDTLEKARPLLDAMGRAILHLGPSGSGALLKLINNFLCGVQAASLAEAMALIERSGLDRDKALEILTNGAPASPLVKTLSERMSARAYTPPNFILRLMAKDLAYAAAEEKRHALEPVTAAAALRIFQQAITHGDGESDLSAVVEQFRTIDAPQ